MKKRHKLTKSVQCYAVLLTEVKSRIRSAQVRATLGANAEMLAMYWDAGRMIEQRQKTEGWGAAVIPRLARDIRNELPEVKGFSKRNIGRMIAFYREYSAADLFLPQPVAKRDGIRPILQQTAAKLPWGHHVTLMEKIKDLPARFKSALPAIETIEKELSE